VLKWYDEKPELFAINPRQLILGLNIYQAETTHYPLKLLELA
jgi:hypothetical protein